MSTEKKASTSAVTPEFRISYPQLFEPKMNDLNKKMEYSVQALFPKGADLSSLKKAAHAACAANWGPDQSKWPTLHNNPFRDQKEKLKDGKMPEGYEAGAIFMTFRSTDRPGVVDQNVQPILDKSKFYAGGYAIAAVNAYAYPKPNNPKGKGIKPGVAFGLNHIQFVRDGETFSGRPKVEDAFKPVEMSSGGADAASVFD